MKPLWALLATWKKAVDVVAGHSNTLVYRINITDHTASIAVFVYLAHDECKVGG